MDLKILMLLYLYVHAQASLPPSDWLIFPSHGSTLIIADNFWLLMFLPNFITCSVLLHCLILWDLKVEIHSTSILLWGRTAILISSTCYPKYYLATSSYKIQTDRWQESGNMTDYFKIVLNSNCKHIMAIPYVSFTRYAFINSWFPHILISVEATYDHS